MRIPALTLTTVLTTTLLSSGFSFASALVSDVLLTDAEGGKAMTTFAATTPKVIVFCRVAGKAQTPTQAVWIAEKVPNVSANFKIANAVVKLPVTSGGLRYNDINFSLSKPNKGWPKGAYRVEIFVASGPGKPFPNTPDTILRFTIK
jgi:hypothetical protein